MCFEKKLNRVIEQYGIDVYFGECVYCISDRVCGLFCDIKFVMNYSIVADYYYYGEILFGWWKGFTSYLRSCICVGISCMVMMIFYN